VAEAISSDMLHERELRVVRRTAWRSHPLYVPVVHSAAGAGRPAPARHGTGPALARHWPGMALARHGTGPERHWPGAALARSGTGPQRLSRIAALPCEWETHMRSQDRSCACVTCVPRCAEMNRPMRDCCERGATCGATKTHGPAWVAWQVPARADAKHGRPGAALPVPRNSRWLYFGRSLRPSTRRRRSHTSYTPLARPPAHSCTPCLAPHSRAMA
jgi:hypothetical protein